MATIEGALFKLLLEQYLLVEHTEHLLVKVVANIFIIDVHLHFLHLIIQMRLFRTVLNFPHLS
jgi:hypothetical protein